MTYYVPFLRLAWVAISKKTVHSQILMKLLTLNKNISEILVKIMFKYYT